MHRVYAAALSLILLLPFVPATARAQEPNVIFLAGDDWGWPFYGFMQRYLAARTTGSCDAGPNAGYTCRIADDCPAGLCNAELVFDDPNERGEEYSDPTILFRFTPSPTRPDAHRMITPVLDFMAATGNFWPMGHNSASVSQPAFCVNMTGLYPGDWVLTDTVKGGTISPTLPEWFPQTYLTMGGGKFQYGVSHVDVNVERRAPWDREMASGGNAGEAGRRILNPYVEQDYEAQALQNKTMERIKDFISCARCIDPSKCLQPTSSDARPDSARMALRAQPGQCTPAPFFIMFSPFIPHLSYRFGDNCPKFPRSATQCNTEPWKSYSRYCNDPNMDWSCANYSSEMAAAFIDATGRPLIERRKIEYMKHINIFDRAIDELMVHLRCPEGANPGCGEDLLSNTVFVHRADHGYELLGAKGGFKEHSYRTPMVLWDARPGSQLPASTERCGGQPGCRNQFAHAVDLLATLRDVSGSTFDCTPCNPPCSPTCESSCPCPRPDGLSRYEGKSLRTLGLRSCNTSDPKYLQCHFGREKHGQGIAHLQNGWYVLAEVKDPQDRVHLCKMYRTCGRPVSIFDLRSDINERENLNRGADPNAFCYTLKDEMIDLLRDNITDKGWYLDCFETAVF